MKNEKFLGAVGLPAGRDFIDVEGSMVPTWHIRLGAALLGMDKVKYQVWRYARVPGPRATLTALMERRGVTDGEHILESLITEGAICQFSESLAEVESLRIFPLGDAIGLRGPGATEYEVRTPKGETVVLSRVEYLFWVRSDGSTVGELVTWLSSEIGYDAAQASEIGRRIAFILTWRGVARLDRAT